VAFYKRMALPEDVERRKGFAWMVAKSVCSVMNIGQLTEDDIPPWVLGR